MEYSHLAPNTTAISQPVDFEIGAVIKGKIKTYLQKWLMDSWESEGFVKSHQKKNKYTYQAPTKESVGNGAYEET